MSVAIAGLVFIYVLVPLYQPEVDANLSGPKIDHRAMDEDNNRPNSNSANPNLRGSITDVLFQPREAEPEHPLDPLLEVARMGLDRIRNDVRDYTAIVVKQERVKGRLRPEEYMSCKVRRNHQTDDASVPRSIYMRFLKPRSLAGQEAIWVENKYKGKLIGHAAGIQNIVRATLEPTGWIAMRGNRYPITEFGIETLLVRMIEKGERDRKYDEVEIEIDRDLTFDGHACTLLTIKHPTQRDHFEFHIAKIYIDDELDIPVGYEGYLWPKEPGGEPQLLEKYLYKDIKLNVGLTDIDFDPDNPEYDFP